MKKREYIQPLSEVLGLNPKDAMLGGGGMLNNSGYEENYMAPGREMFKY